MTYIIPFLRTSAFLCCVIATCVSTADEQDNDTPLVESEQNSFVSLGYDENVEVQEENSGASVSIPEPLRDAAFEQFVSLETLRGAVSDLDEEAFVDCAIQFAYAEQILSRAHFSGLTSTTLATRAVFRSIRRDNKAAIERLVSAGARLGKNDWKDLEETIREDVSGSRAEAPRVALDTVSSETISTVQALIQNIEVAEMTDDLLLLAQIQSAIKDNELSESQIEYVSKRIESAKALVSSRSNEESILLRELQSGSRGTADLKPTLGSSLEQVIKASTPSQYRDHVTVDRLTVDDGGTVRGQVTVQYGQWKDIPGIRNPVGRGWLRRPQRWKIWSARLVVYWTLPVRNPQLTNIKLDIGPIKGAVNTKALRTSVTRWISGNTTTIERRRPRTYKIWIENPFSYPIHYKLNGDSFTVPGNYTKWHSSGKAKFGIEFDSSFSTGYQRKGYSLTPGSRNYFTRSGNNLDLYKR